MKRKRPPLLRLDNRTRWNSADLRRFFLAGLRKLKCGPRTVRIRYGHRKALTGWAYYHSKLLQIHLPGPRYLARYKKIWPRKNPLNLLELAQTFEHEIDHTKGLTHAEMPEWQSLRPLWHKGINIRWDLPDQEIGLRAAKRKLKAAEKRLASAKRAKGKWRKKIRELKHG